MVNREKKTLHNGTFKQKLLCIYNILIQCHLILDCHFIYITVDNCSYQLIITYQVSA